MKNKMTLADRLLAKFASMPRSTANEVGIDGLKLEGVQLSSAQKRVNDLIKRGYLLRTNKRECSKSGKLAAEFKITTHGIEHLRAKKIPFSIRGKVSGMDGRKKERESRPDDVDASPSASLSREVSMSKDQVRDRLAALRAKLS